MHLVPRCSLRLPVGNDLPARHCHSHAGRAQETRRVPQTDANPGCHCAGFDAGQVEFSVDWRWLDCFIHAGVERNMPAWVMRQSNSFVLVDENVMKRICLCSTRSAHGRIHWQAVRESSAPGVAARVCRHCDVVMSIFREGAPVRWRNRIRMHRGRDLRIDFWTKQQLRGQPIPQVVAAV